MADFETVDKRRKKKRKQRSSELNEGDSVATGVVSSQQQDEEIDEQRIMNKKIKQGGPWNNLDLILSLQNKELDVQRKVELAIEFVNSRKLKRDDDSDGGSETVSVSRLIGFLSDWIQSLLISPIKKIRVEEKKPRVIEACLDVRCWVIFKFCLEESLCLRVPLNVSPNLLRALSCIGRDVLLVMEKKQSFIHGEGSELYSLLLDSVSLLFSSHGGVFNGNADQWVTLVATLIDLVHKLYLDKVSGHSVGNLLLRLSYLILERFSNFLRVHPSPKNIFTVFLDRLLEPLLSLLAVLYIQTDSSDSRWAVNLLKTVEDILSNGLFHPVHVVGFLNLSTHSTEKYMRLDDGKAKKLNKDIKSYHRHFFQKLEKIMSKKTVSAFSGMGELFRLFVIRVKKQKGVHVLSEVTKMTGETGLSRDMEKTNDGLMSKMSTGNGKAAPENAYSLNRIDTVTSKAFFDLFVRFMKPLALDIKGYSETNLEVGSMLFDALCTLKSVNKILAGFMREKVYERTEDTSEGACLNFLKEFYQIIISFSAKIQLFWLSTLKVDSGRPMEMLPLVAKEVIVSLGYFLEIEYEVVGNDLVSLWHTILSYLAIDLFVRGTAERCLLTSEILHLGCQLINIYSDLRQVNNPIFALCKAVRLFGVAAKNGTEHSTSVSCTSSLSSETCVKSVIMLLCLQEFRLAICNAIKSIPEGQASGCIRQLTVDISESLDWIKVSCSRDQEKDIGPNLQNCVMPNLYLQAELLGKALSEVYTIILDDLAVTTGNSILVGNSIKSLMKTVGPSLSTLVGKQPDSINEFLFSVIGRRLSLNEMRECSNGLPIVRSSASWVFLFFFRVYISLRSLYRQSICLMPPDSSRKASAAMGDLFTANSGQDCKGSTDWRDEGYFSWVVKPSGSLMAILQSVSEICHQETVTGCAPLVYVMHVMAFQRLVDLNRQINAFEFLQEGAVRLVEMNSMDEACLPMYRKESKKLKKTLSVLRQEAVDVTNFLMGYLQLIVKKVESISTDDCATSAGEESQIAHEDDAWDLSVSSLNEMSLPIAVWQILCQNTDIWCPHATKKELRKFLFLLFHIFLSCAKGSCEDVGKHNMGKPDNSRKVTLHQISLELLGDTVFYEQTFLRRHLTSRFCDTLEKSVLSLFGDSMSKDVDLSSLPDWSEVLSELEKTSVILQNKRHVADGAFSALRPDSVPSDSPSVKYSKEFAACLSLLDLLRWMPKGYPKSKSFSVYATYILNLERLVVFRLLDHGKVHVHNHYELFKLFVCCRKTLKHLVMASCEVNSEVGQFSVLPIFSENSYSVLWLLKSVSALVQHLPAFPEEHATQVKYMVFSLMDHTSYVFLTFTKDQFGLAVNTLKHYEQPSAELPISGELTGKDNLNESDPKSEFSKHFEALRSVEHMAESLKEHTKSLFTSLKMVLPNEKLKVGFNVVDLNKISTTISCFQGFLWGISSVLKDRFEQCTEETKSLRGGFARSSKLNLCITMFEDFINFCLHALLVEDFREPDHLDNDQSLRERDNINDPLSLKGSNGSQLKFSEGVVEVSTQHQEGKISGKMDELLSDPDDNHEIPQSSQNTFVENSSVRRKRFKSKYADCAINILNEVDSFDKQCLKKSLLRSLLKGEHPEVAFSIRQLFIASSAILTLKMQIYSSTFSSSSMPISIGTSHFLLSELADMVEEPHSFSFVWLDGILKYLEVLGSYISLTNPTSSRNVYARLINLHLRAIGKCISLQGKGATLASHETESSTKTLMRQIRSSKSSVGHGQYSLHEFKARLRMSFKVFIKKPLELHLLTSIQALERALIGVHEEWNTIYEINTGGPHGGKVSSNVAAGVDCFDLVLESVSGRSRLSMVKKHIRSLIAALFNIVLHLQDPLIFYERISWTNGGCDPDSGSVILMCVEVLTKVAAKPALFEMDPCHVGQSLRIPAALFRDFHLLRSSKSLSSTLLSASQCRNAVADTHPYIVDQQFSVDLFAACCRLLSTVLRHHGSESERCISVVEESVSILLHCLEMVDTGLVGREGYYAWEVMQGTKCASFLRRIYEEIRQQKEVLGRYSSHFLSTYIWVYSGYGPFKTGIRREVDEALRPGVYALLDACSTDDLQQLHTVLGEAHSQTCNMITNIISSMKGKSDLPQYYLIKSAIYYLSATPLPTCSENIRLWHTTEVAILLRCSCMVAVSSTCLPEQKVLDLLKVGCTCDTKTTEAGLTYSDSLVIISLKIIDLKTILSCYGILVII